MPSFICDFLNEIVILSDGSVTTCCMDPLGINTFGSIYHESISAIAQKYADLRQRIARDVFGMPRCVICYNKIKKAGFPQTGTYIANPSDEDIRDFLNNTDIAVARFVIELSSLCNLKCNGCMHSRVNFREYRAEPLLDANYLKKWLHGHIGAISNIRLYNYGETFVHPQAIGFCSFIKGQNPGAYISVATNGLLLNNRVKRRKLIQSGVDDIIFSIHGSSQETIQQYMSEKFRFESILNILKDMVAVKRELALDRPKLIWKYLLFDWNDSDEEIENARSLSKKLGLDSLSFSLVGFPSPSKRFTPDSENWKILNHQR